jgi:hypothetical protein
MLKYMCSMYVCNERQMNDYFILEIMKTIKLKNKCR